jgi:hypothetical protein
METRDVVTIIALMLGPVIASFALWCTFKAEKLADEDGKRTTRDAT